MAPRLLSTLALLGAAASPSLARAARPLARGQTACAQQLTKDVVIIGGGSGGTYAAVQLTRQGVDVAVVEKAAVLGGHANTFVDPSGVPHNVGVVSFDNTTTVRDYFAALGVPLYLTSAFHEADPSHPTEYVDFVRGEPADYTPPSSADLGAALTAFRDIILADYPYLQDGFYLPDPVPEELLLPFGQFAIEHGIQDAVATLAIYGQPEETQNVLTVYEMTQFRPVVLNSILSGTMVSTNDTMDLYRSAASFLGDRVLFNSVASRVERSDSGVTVTVATDGADGATCIAAKKLLMATYPVPENLAGWDLSAAEQALLAKFHVGSYFVGIGNHGGLDPALQYAGATSNADRTSPNATLGVGALPGIVVIGGPLGSSPERPIWSGSEDVVASDAMKQLVADQLEQLEAHGVIGPGELELVEWWDHTPFKPRVSADDIRAGFYSELYGLQGQKSTYWTGAAFQSQDSSLIWAYTEGLLADLAA